MIWIYIYNPKKYWKLNIIIYNSNKKKIIIVFLELKFWKFYIMPWYREFNLVVDKIGIWYIGSW